MIWGRLRDTLQESLPLGLRRWRRNHPVPAPRPASTTGLGRGRWIGALLGLLAGLWAGCGTLSGAETPADRLFAAGDLAAAEMAYREALRQDPSAPRQDRALYRLAVLYGLPESPAYDPEQSEACLERLLAQFPGSELGPQARAWLAARRQLGATRLELETERRRLAESEAALAEVRGRLAEVEAQLAERDQRADASTRLAEDRRRRIAELETALAASTQRAQRLERDLSELKRIDLGSPP